MPINAIRHISEELSIFIYSTNRTLLSHRNLKKLFVLLMENLQLVKNSSSNRQPRAYVSIFTYPQNTLSYVH